MNQPLSPSQLNIQWRFRRWIGLVLLACLIGQYASKAARADAVIFKDGYTVYGKIFVDMKGIEDPNTGNIYPIQAGFHKIDDGARIVVFSPNYRQIGDVENKFDKFANFVTLKTQFPSGATKSQLVVNTYPKKEVDFNERWMRRVDMIDATTGKLVSVVQQQIVIMTPHFIRLDSSSHAWGCSYLTQEWGPEKVIKLLRMHPDVKEEPGKPESGKRKKLILFMLQAQWFDHADKELAEYIKAFPEDKETAANFRRDILTSRADVYLDELDIALAAGRHKFIAEKLPQFPKEGVASAQSLRYSTFKAKHDELMSQYDKAKSHLEKLTALKFAPNEQFLTAAGKTILAELHVDGVPRLKTFVTLAEEVERDIKAGRPSGYKPEELLSLAVTGWLLGKASAETKTDVARKLWDAREMLRTYLSDDNNTHRLSSLGKLKERTDLPPIDELAQIISLMPPPFENKDYSTTMKQYNTGRVKGFANGVDFVLQLPPEYHKARRTPLLIVLPDGGESPENVIKKFGDLPARYGYIVASPIWNGGVRSTYQFTEEERGTVPALIGFLQRFLNVDSDKVFLFGCNEAANMAYDVGLSHPDLFAGVIPMCMYPSERTFAPNSRSPSKIVLREYSLNAQKMPMYFILGDRVGDDAAKVIQASLKNWMPRGFPVIASAYKGRNPEFFGYELPNVFDWMSRKKRVVHPLDFGRAGFGTEGIEYRTMRQEDNQFYWISSGEIDPNKTLEKKPKGEFIAARLSAKSSEGNVVRISAVGFRQLTVWVPPALFELDKPVKIIINDGQPFNSKTPLKPNLQVMLEDLYERGDRQRIYIEKFEFKGSPYLPSSR